MKHFLPFFTLFYLGVAGSMMAQPVFTADNYTNIIGSTYTRHSAGIVDAGPSGANQVWDFSALTSLGSTTIEIVDVASTPAAASFPNSSFAALIDGQYGYFRLDNAGIYTNGVATIGDINAIYTDERTEIILPMSYQQTYFDENAYYLEGAAFPTTLEGETNATVDGYGTLITPDATYNNVLRLHYVENDVMVMEISEDFVSEVATVLDTYVWLVEGVPLPVFTVGTITTDGGTPETTVSYMSNIPTGIEETEIIGVTIYPNPAVDVVTIDLGDNSAKEISVDIIDVKGSVVAQLSTSTFNKSRFELNIQSLEAGVYFVRIATDKGTTIEKLIK